MKPRGQIPVEKVRGLLRDNLLGLNDEPAHVVMVATAEFYRLDLSKMLTPTRGTPRLAWPRQVSMWLCRELTTISLEQLGRIYGKDPGAVLYAWRVVNERRAVLAELCAELDALKASVRKKLRSKP